MRLARWALALAGLALAGCAHVPKGPAPALKISVEPAPPTVLAPGTVVKIRAWAEPKAQLQWVSGTVKVFRAPVLAFKPEAGSLAWIFKTQVPPMTTVPPGRYQVKAWGRSVDGQDVNGQLDFEVR